MSTIKLSWGIGVVVRGLLLTMAQVWWGALPGKDAGPAVLLRCKVVLRNYMGWKKAWGNKKKKSIWKIQLCSHIICKLEKR